MYNKVRPPPLASSDEEGVSNDLHETLVATTNRSRPLKYYWDQLLASWKSNGKPPSNPWGWPEHVHPDDLAEHPNRIIKIGQEQEYAFCTNFVKTSKYEVWDFPGKFLFEEFDPRTKIANCYFLAISMLQCAPPITNTAGIPTTLIPLLFIIFVDATFQLLEDAARHRADTKENSSPAYKYNPHSGRFEECKWFEIAVGDCIRIDTRAQVPADVVILAVAEKTEPPQGLCYVETKSLDGETNLKIRQALPKTMAKVFLWSR
jgi:magnesium-transporting ATPase (P-type)